MCIFGYGWPNIHVLIHPLSEDNHFSECPDSTLVKLISKSLISTAVLKLVLNLAYSSIRIHVYTAVLEY